MPDDDRFSLTELADLAGVTPRTVRYYLAQGLLPAVGPSGPGSKYDEGHLLRLRLIRRLQGEHLPLAEIRRRIEGLSETDIQALSTAEQQPQPTDSALDYLRTVLGARPGPAPASASIAPPKPATPDRPIPRRPLMLSEPSLAPQPSAARAPAASSEIPIAPRLSERSQWERIALAPDVELHIRRPLARIQQKQIDRLVTIARELLEEDRS